MTPASKVPFLALRYQYKTWEKGITRLQVPKVLQRKALVSGNGLQYVRALAVDVCVFGISTNEIDTDFDTDSIPYFPLEVSVIFFFYNIDN